MGEEEMERFEVQMSHVHLPMIQESGFVEYDERSEELLEFTKQYEEPSF